MISEWLHGIYAVAVIVFVAALMYKSVIILPRMGGP